MGGLNQTRARSKKATLFAWLFHMNLVPAAGLEPAT